MDFEKLDVGQLLKFLFYTVAPIVLFCLVGIGVAAILVKMNKDKRTKREAEEQTRLAELREKQKIERMSTYYQKLREKGRAEKDME